MVLSVTTPAAATYKPSDTMSFTLNFTNNITLTGTSSTLALTIGSTTKSAAYASKTANSITYSYTVQSGDLDTDGITVGAVSLNTDTLVDASTSQAYISFGSLTTTGISGEMA